MIIITLEMAIAKIKKLPAEQRNEAIKFVEYLEFKLDNIEQSQEQYCRVRQPPAFPFPHKRWLRPGLRLQPVAPYRPHNATAGCDRL